MPFGGLNAKPIAPPSTTLTSSRMPRRSTVAANGPSETPNDAETSTFRCAKLPSMRIQPEVDQLQLEGTGGQRRHREARAQAGAVDEAQLAGDVGLGGDVEPELDAVAEDHLEEAVARFDRRLGVRARRTAAAARRSCKLHRDAELADRELHAELVAADDQRAIALAALEIDAERRRRRSPSPDRAERPARARRRRRSPMKPSVMLVPSIGLRAC